MIDMLVFTSGVVFFFISVIFTVFYPKTVLLVALILLMLAIGFLFGILFLCAFELWKIGRGR